MVELFRPHLIKLIFLVEWTLFIAFELLRGELETKHDFLVIGYPLVVFYLIAWLFMYLSRRNRFLFQGWKLLSAAICLSLVDQLFKSLVVSFIPLGSSFSAINGWLHIAHLQNYHGSWLLSSLNLPSMHLSLLVLGVFVVVVFSIFYHRYYVSRYRHSIWADIAFLGICAGLLSWLWDMLWRGRIIDFIKLPEIVTADFKDILIYLGTAAIFAETLDNPDITFKWKGWRVETRDFHDLFLDFLGFIIHDLRGVRK